MYLGKPGKLESTAVGEFFKKQKIVMKDNDSVRPYDRRDQGNG